MHRATPDEWLVWLLEEAAARRKRIITETMSQGTEGAPPSASRTTEHLIRQIDAFDAMANWLEHDVDLLEDDEANQLRAALSTLDHFFTKYVGVVE